MDLEHLRTYCLSKPDVTESMPFGPDVLVFKVNNKLFLLTPFDETPLQFNVKCDPELAITLRSEFSCVMPGYHMNKQHWNTIIVDGSMSRQMLKEQIDNSYDLVKKSPKKK
jgi:predicted DNA-binding protein (MmcQ/YjbR family)